MMPMPSTHTSESGNLHFEEVVEKKDNSTARKVCFNSRVWCRRSKKTHHMNPEDRWYSRDEIASFRKRDKYLQSLAAGGTTSVAGEDDTEDVSFVGLASQRERKQRIMRNKEAENCVLREQMRQEDEFDSTQNDRVASFKLDQECIAEFYSVYSRRATELAHMKGMQVARHVEHLLEEESIDTDASQRSGSRRSCSQHSKSTSGHRPQRNSSNRSTGSIKLRV